MVTNNIWSRTCNLFVSMYKRRRLWGTSFCWPREQQPVMLMERVPCCGHARVSVPVIMELGHEDRALLTINLAEHFHHRTKSMVFLYEQQWALLNESASYYATANAGVPQTAAASRKNTAPRITATPRDRGTGIPHNVQQHLLWGWLTVHLSSTESPLSGAHLWLWGSSTSGGEETTGRWGNN